MEIAVKALIGILNLIYDVMKIRPERAKITFLSRQSDEKSEDMLLLEKQLRLKAPEVELVFLCRKMKDGIAGKLKYCLHIFTQMKHISNSKVVILDSYCPAVSVLKQRDSLAVIQMWHALGSLKKFGYSIIGKGEGRTENTAEMFSMHKNYTYILSSSKASLPYFAEAFGYDESHMRVMPLPRVDMLTSWDAKEKALRRIYEEYPCFREKKVVLYAPTLRRGGDISEGVRDLAEAFSSPDYVFVLKKHPLMDVKCDSGIADEKFTTIEMMFAADYVICDYSAVIFEAALMEKPVFFYTFDYEAYGDNRDFYIDYMKEMPGFISGDPYAIEKAVASDDYDPDRIRDFARKYVENRGDCGKRLADFIIKQM